MNSWYGFHPHFLQELCDRKIIIIGYTKVTISNNNKNKNYNDLFNIPIVTDT